MSITDMTLNLMKLDVYKFGYLKFNSFLSSSSNSFVDIDIYPAIIYDDAFMCLIYIPLTMFMSVCFDKGVSNIDGADSL